MRTADLQLEYWERSGWFDYYLDVAVDGYRNRTQMAAFQRLLDRFRDFDDSEASYWVANFVWVWGEDR